MVDVVDVAAAEVVVNNCELNLGLGVGWRPELAMHIERRDDLGFVEIVADNHFLDSEMRKPFVYLKKKGLKVVVHSIGLSLGGAQLPSDDYIDELNRVCELYDGVLFSEHIAFVRSKSKEAGHLLPVKRDEESLQILIENINYAKKRLCRPLVLENIASFVEWPGNTISEPEFISRILEETGCGLLLDISNLYANSVNNKFDPLSYLDNLPLDKVAYMHIAGGVRAKGLYHDTHSHALNEPVLKLLESVCLKVDNPSVLLERDDQFPMQDELFAELDMIEKAMSKKKEALYVK